MRAVCTGSDLERISPTSLGGHGAGQSQMRWGHTHIWMDDSLLLLLPAALMSKGMNLVGAIIRIRNRAAARYVTRGGKRTRPEKKPLRTTTKASRGWQEGLKKGLRGTGGGFISMGGRKFSQLETRPSAGPAAEQKSSLSGERGACRRPKETPRTTSSSSPTPSASSNQADEDRGWNGGQLPLQ